MTDGLRKRVEISQQMRSLLISARRIAVENDAQALVILAEVPFDFAAIKQYLRKVRLIVASDKPDVQKAAKDDETDLVPLVHEPQTRQLQISQALLEAIADDLLQPGDRIVAIYPVYERSVIDTISLVSLSEHLAKLTARDLRRLETTVPLETLRLVVDLAVEIGREGREGKPVGTMFVVGNHRKVLQMSHEQVHDPFRGYNQRERMIRNPRVRESMKEIAQLDGAFVDLVRRHRVRGGPEYRRTGRGADALQGAWAPDIGRRRPSRRPPTASPLPSRSRREPCGSSKMVTSCYGSSRWTGR